MKTTADTVTEKNKQAGLCKGLTGYLKKALPGALIWGKPAEEKSPPTPPANQPGPGIEGTSALDTAEENTRYLSRAPNLKPYVGDLKGVDGWLAPDGKFYECHYVDHMITADKLSKRYGYRMTRRFPYHMNGEYTLEINGWVKLSLSRVHYNCEKPMTKKQLDFLFDYFMANDRAEEYPELLSRYGRD